MDLIAFRFGSIYGTPAKIREPEGVFIHFRKLCVVISPATETAPCFHQHPAAFTDVLLQDTWLLALAIRNHPPVTVDDALYQYCFDMIQRVQDQLAAAGAPDDIVDEITFAHCVFLDEVVMTQPDTDVSVWWKRTPLQGHFLGHIHGGEHFYEHIKKLLHEPAPSLALVSGYHRMLLLGYKGKYKTEDSDERLSLMQQLEKLLPKVSGKERQQVTVVSTGTREGQWWRSPQVILMALVLFTAGMWAGLRLFLLAQ